MIRGQSKSSSELGELVSSLVSEVGRLEFRNVEVGGSSPLTSTFNAEDCVLDPDHSAGHHPSFIGWNEGGSRTCADLESVQGRSDRFSAIA